MSNLSALIALAGNAASRFASAFECGCIFRIPGL